MTDLLHRMTEAELMENIRAFCTDLGLMAFHCHDSRRSWGAGFPDLVVAGPHGVIFREAKNSTNTLSPDQRKWGSVLHAAGADWATWRPRDLLDGTVQRQLIRISAYAERTPV